RVPDADRLIHAGSGHMASVRAKGDSGNLGEQLAGLLSAQPEKFLARPVLAGAPRIPEAHRPVADGAAGSELLAVRAEGHAQDPFAVPAERLEQPPARYVPDADLLILPRGRHPLAVRAEGHAPDPAGMGTEGEPRLASGGVPQGQRPVRPGDSELLAVGA